MSDGTASEAEGLGAKFRTPVFWATLLSLGLGAAVYSPLFFPSSVQDLTVRTESFFFQANEAAGAPVLALSLWLFYRRSHLRDVLLGPGSTLAGALALSSSLALFAWGTATGAPDLRLASIIPLLAGAVLLLGGRAGLRAFWLPILFLAFALPVSPVLISTVIYPIQLVTAQFAGLLLNGFGFDAIVQGDQILRPENSFVVIETCSGVRTMITLGMLTVLLIDLFERRGWHALILMLSAPVIAFAVNGLRVVTLVLNPYSSVHSVHNLQGIVMLLVGLTLVYLIDGRVEFLLAGRDSNPGEVDYGIKREAGVSSGRRAWNLAAVALLLVAMLAVDRFVEPWQFRQTLDETPSELLTRVLGDDSRPSPPVDYIFAGSVGYLAQARHRVWIDGAMVEVFVGIANEQRREISILSKRLAWPASGYSPVEESFVPIGEGHTVVRRMVLRRHERFLLTYSWIARRQDLLTEWFRQAVALDRSPFVRPEHLLAIRMTTEIPRDAAGANAAEERLRTVWRRLAPELESYAPGPSLR